MPPWLDSRNCDDISNVDNIIIIPVKMFYYWLWLACCHSHCNVLGDWIIGWSRGSKCGQRVLSKLNFRSGLVHETVASCVWKLFFVGLIWHMTNPLHCKVMPTTICRSVKNSILYTYFRLAYKLHPSNVLFWRWQIQVVVLVSSSLLKIMCQLRSRRAGDTLQSGKGIQRADTFMYKA